MRRLGWALALLLAASIVAPSAAHAQGSGSSGDRSLPNFQTSRSFEGEIVKIDPGEGLLVLRLERKGEFLVELHEKTELKADKKTGLDERELTLKDFPVGSRVKLTIRTSDGRLLEMRLREPKES